MRFWIQTVVILLWFVVVGLGAVAMMYFVGTASAGDGTLILACALSVNVLGGIALFGGAHWICKGFDAVFGPESDAP